MIIYIVFLLELISIPGVAISKLNRSSVMKLLNFLTCFSMENFSWFFTVWSTSEPCILSHDFLQWCCSFRVQYKTDWNFGLLVVYIREISPNRELSKRAKGLGGSGVGSGRTNESFYAKNKLPLNTSEQRGDGNMYNKKESSLF